MRKITYYHTIFDRIINIWLGRQLKSTQTYAAMITCDYRWRFTKLFVLDTLADCLQYTVLRSYCRSCIVGCSATQTITRTATSYLARPTHGKFLELKLTKQIVRMVGLSLGQIWICLRLHIKSETEDRIVTNFYFAQFSQFTLNLSSN